MPGSVAAEEEAIAVGDKIITVRIVLNDVSSIEEGGEHGKVSDGGGQHSSQQQGGHHGNLATLHLRHIGVYTCAYLKVKGGVGKQQGGRWRRETKQGKQQRVKTLMNARFLLVLDKWQIY